MCITENSKPGRTTVHPKLSSELLHFCLSSLLSLALLFSALPGAVSPAPGAAAASTAVNLSTVFQDPSLQEPLNLLDTRLPVTEVSREERDLVIHLYESSYPEQVKGLQNFLENGSFPSAYDAAEDLKNIKYMVYSAPADWRSLFLTVIGQLNLCCDPSTPRSGQTSASATDCYVGGNVRTVYVDLTQAARDPRGPYVSFFHECGHGIDDCCLLQNSCPDSPNLSEQLRADEISLHTLLLEELDTYLSKEENRNKLTLQIFTAPEEAVSDMLSAYLAMQHSTTRVTGYTHTEAYWEENSSNLESEFFAEYFSYQMCSTEGAAPALTATEAVFPQATALLQQTAAFRESYLSALTGL